LDCWSVAQRLGWKRASFTRFLRRLPPHALVDTPTTEATAVRRYWSLMEAAGAPHHTDDVGRVREQAALHRLRPRHPMAKLRAGREAIGDAAIPPARDRATSHAHPGRSPHGVYAPQLRAAHPGSNAEGVAATLAVLVAHGAVEPRRVRPYARRETPVLPVVLRELDVVIGPLLHAGGPCVRCLHLTLTDEDLRWPAVATQLASETNPGIDPVVSQLAAALAAHQVIAIADERPAAVVGRSLHVDGAHPVPRHRAWHPHARCGCQLAHLA